MVAIFAQSLAASNALDYHSTLDYLAKERERDVILANRAKKSAANLSHGWSAAIDWHCEIHHRWYWIQCALTNDSGSMPRWYSRICCGTASLLLANLLAFQPNGKRLAFKIISALERHQFRHYARQSNRLWWSAEELREKFPLKAPCLEADCSFQLDTLILFDSLFEYNNLISWTTIAW